MGRGWRTRGKMLDRRYRAIREAKGHPAGEGSRSRPRNQEEADSRRRARSLFDIDTALGRSGVVKDMPSGVRDQLRSLSRDYVAETNPDRQNALRQQMARILEGEGVIGARFRATTDALDAMRNIKRHTPDNFPVPDGFDAIGAAQRFQSQAGVTVRGAGTPASLARIESYFGKDVTVADLKKTLNLPEGTRVEFQPMGNNLRVLVTGKEYGQLDFTMKRDKSGNLIAEVGLLLPGKGVRGLRTSDTTLANSFKGMKSTMERMGVERIDTYGGMGAGLNGAVQLARYGFNGKIPSRSLSAIRKEIDSLPGISAKEKARLRQVTTIQGLMRSDVGAKLWRKHATKTAMSFNLKKGSGDQKNFRDYVEPKLSKLADYAQARAKRSKTGTG